MKKECEIVICGDLCPTHDTEDLFMLGDAEGLFKDILAVFRQADLLIGNLEFPLTNIGSGIKKCGPILKGNKSCVNVLKAAGFDVLGMANNHIRDCGDEGVLSSIECCRNEGILTVGAGENTATAKKTLFIDVKGWKIGIMAFTEHEFNAATESRAGANLLDPFYSFDDIKECRNKCDYLIILNHGGIEHYEYPSPLLQKKCRKMVESGADTVLCQHSHCVGTSENYKGGTIVYGQGNTVYGHRPKSPAWNEGLIIKITLPEEISQKTSVEYIPIMAGPSGIDLMPEKKTTPFLKDFFEHSKKIIDTDFINDSWKLFCKTKEAHYMPHLLGLGRILNHVNRKLKNSIVNIFYSKKRMRITMNLIRCEAHHELVKTILEEKVEDNKAD